MSLDVVYGESRNPAAAQALAAQLRTVVDEGTVYLAYPVLSTADERVEVDALLVSRTYGLVAFLLADDLPAGDGWDAVVAQQDRLYAVLEGHLRRHEGLRSGRRLAVVPNTATIFPAPVSAPPLGTEGFYGDMQEVPHFIRSLSAIEPTVERNLQAALQRVSTIKPAKKRSGVERPSSRGARLKEIELGIANLDRWQKAAAIESPRGPQRIRGLAGSGKTVVLALKAAYWHSQNPTWRIAVTFHSRALYQQFADLVTRFNDVVTGHRLAYVLCPFEVDQTLLLEGEPIADVVSLHTDLEDITLRSPVRFDYDPDAATSYHPAAHLTINSPDCRIACVAPMHVHRFVDFVFRHFYARLWQAHSPFFASAAWRHLGVNGYKPRSNYTPPGVGRARQGRIYYDMRSGIYWTRP